SSELPAFVTLMHRLCGNCVCGGLTPLHRGTPGMGDWTRAGASFIIRRPKSQSRHAEAVGGIRESLTRCLAGTRAIRSDMERPGTSTAAVQPESVLSPA